MATNYMTVAEAELFDLEARLWRLKQAIEIPDPDFITTRLDREMLKLRFNATLKLFRIIQEQLYLWEGCDENEKKRINDSGVTAEEWLKNNTDEPDYKMMPGGYESQFDFADEDFIHPDCCWLSITRPEDSMWLDLPGKVKAKKKKAACKILKKTMSEEAYDKLMVEDELDRMNTHADRYEKHLREANECSIKYEGKPIFTEQQIADKVQAEVEYYRKLKQNNLKATGYYDAAR
jgi:hypothetical protein